MIELSEPTGMSGLSRDFAGVQPLALAELAAAIDRSVVTATAAARATHTKEDQC